MFTIDHDRVAVHEVHTCVLGSGAAGLNAALQLKRHGIDDLLLLTEGLDKGTSINTGSDKQTYYKLGLYGGEPDSPHKMAATFFDGGSMHGDTALIEAALSARAFYNLLELGVPFPQDRFGQFPGYKTDHDPLQRATSIGPYTSRAMCRALIAAIKRIGVPVRENRIAVKLPTLAGESDSAAPRVAGVLCVDTHAPPDACLELYLCENLVFAVGGPGGLYRESVYPVPHTGGIGLALEIGAEARNLADSQYGLASTRFRWNVSGTYMQVLPRLVSTAADGASDRREFLLRYFGTPEKTACAVFLKGYQWPFDVRKIDGSSLIDLAVFIETVEKHRRVFLDYRTNMTGLDVTVLPGEVRDYLEKSGALSGTPIERLAKMNMPAVELYREHGIDLAREPLEIALCAQHNNGGLAVGPWWESTNIRHLFPAGEVAGTHGI
ncbi:MAG TPA: oxidoreductase, partial [Planctomycetaceae bacterium]|nr:oxidoreductase [Planctomycetaceae bacterium]